jgi:L-ascorbate metabolism protein UlaG (beta-lactamase superfamily)
MHVEWYGQSAFRLSADGTTVFIDPFGDMSALAARGMTWEYPPITDVTADLLLITHDHGDHNAVDVIGGSPRVIRVPGTHDDVVGIASEHDEEAGTKRGPNTIFAFTLDGVRVAHFGDFGQAALREEQAAALGTVDLLLIPVGGGPTIGAGVAADIAGRVGARWTCRCTTAPSGSASSSRSTGSPIASSAWCGWTRRGSSWTSCRASARSSWCPPRRDVKSRR